MRHVDRRGVRAVVGVWILVAVLGGCAKRGAVVDAAQSEAAPVVQSQLTINPADGSAGVSPTELVTAVVTGGQLTQVKLATADGAPLIGALSPDGERWTASQPLKPNTAYVLNAGARSVSGQESTTTTRFSTLAPGQQVTGKITPAGPEPVPADRPISVLFDKPIGDRAAVERALRITANPAANGNTEWLSDRELLWRPAPAWPPGGQVTVSLAIYGKQLGNGLFGGSDLRSAFAVLNSDGGGLALRSAGPSGVVPAPSVSRPVPPSSKPGLTSRSSGSSASARPSTSPGPG